MAKLQDKMFNRVIEGKFVAQSGDELPKELPAVSSVDNGKALVVSGGKWVAGTISAGGTQLYKHEITSEGGNITVISLSSVQITEDNFDTEFAKLVTSALNVKDDEGDMLIVSNTNESLNKVNSAGTGLSGEYLFEYFAMEIEDTVTPL